MKDGFCTSVCYSLYVHRYHARHMASFSELRKIPLITGLLAIVLFYAQVVPAVDSKEPSPVSRYSIPTGILEKPLRFAGELIPLGRPDVQARVQFQLNFLLLDARSVLATWLVDKSRYDWIFEEIFKKEGIPRDFILFSPVLGSLSAGSSNRSAGVGWWALEKPCNSSEGFTMSDNTWHDDRLDLEYSTKCFAARLKSIKKELGTDSWLTAAAAYVTSTKTVDETGKHWNTLKYWDLPLPDNAESLIVRWIALGIIRANPAAFGIKVSESPPLTYDQINGLILAKDLSIGEIARMLGVNPRLILELNPKIKPSLGKFPAKVGGKPLTHSLAVPKGSGWTLVNNLKKNAYLVEGAAAR